MSEVDDYVDRWHDSNSSQELHDFLGMSKQEYELFITDENYLGIIISAHKFGKNIEDIIREEISMAARSENPAKAKRLQKWLEREGLWD